MILAKMISLRSWLPLKIDTTTRMNVLFGDRGVVIRVEVYPKQPLVEDKLQESAGVLGKRGKSTLAHAESSS